MENNIILTPVPLETLLQSFRAIIKEEIKAEVAKEQDEKLLSPAEACKVFQPAISKPTLQTWSESGYLNKHKIGNKVFYKLSELIAGATTLQRYKTKKPASGN